MPLKLVRSLGLALLPLTACSGGGGATCTGADALDAGTAAATIDGTAWSTPATFVWQGDTLQVNTSPSGGWFLTLVGQTTTAGDTVKAAVDAGDFPVEIGLSDGASSGAWALAYPTEGDSYHTENADGGTFTIAAATADELTGCFAFSAGTEAGDVVEVSDGSVRAGPFSR